MSRLQELIQRLCPNGVEFKTLGEVAKVQRGVRVVKSELHESGDIPVYQNSLKPLGYSEQSNFSAYKTYIIAAGGAGDLGFSEIPFWAADDCYVVLPQEILLDKFLYYIILNQQSVLKRHVRKASIPRLSKLIIEKLSIPVPPMEVQEEIVKILDRFSDYAAELQAELQARKEQYEYYRNLLLTFNPAGCANGADGAQKIGVTTWGGHSYEIQWKKLCDIGPVKMCKRIMKHQTNQTTGIPFYKIGSFGGVADAFIDKDLYDEYKCKYPFPTKGAILISAAGTIGKTVIYHGEDAYFQDSNIVWIENDEKIVLNKYLYYFYKTVDWKTEGGTIKRLYNNLLSSTSIPIPPMELQEKIVAVLDRFETLVNDLREGLPAEIAAVREQYEYYRNRLLTFPHLTA